MTLPVIQAEFDKTPIKQEYVSSILTLASGKTIDFMSQEHNLEDMEVHLDFGDSTATLKIDPEDHEY